MTNFVSTIRILFCLNFVSFPCEGIITLPPHGDTFVVDPGNAKVEIAWTFNDTISVATVRQWKFLATGEALAVILGNGNVVYENTSLPDYEIIKPATLVLKNVDDRYNGKYEFSINTGIPKSSVTVFIAEKTNVTTCSSPVSGNEVRPEKPTLTFSSNPAVAGKSLEMKCEAKAFPLPSYTITKIVSNDSTYNIEEMEYSDGGSYKCIAMNKLGMNSVTDDLKAVGPIQPTTIMPSSNACDKVERKCVVVWHILLSLLSGIIIGALLLYTVQYYRRRFRNRKPQSDPQPETSKVDSIYQDLDLGKMNDEDNYQSFRVNSGRNDADYENQSNSTYTELNKVKDVENNYQSLT